MKGRSEFDGPGDYRIRRGGLLDDDVYHRLERLCFLWPFQFFVEVGLNGPEYERPELAWAVEVAGPLLTQANRDYWTGRGLVMADAAGRVRVAGVVEDIDWLQELLCFRHGYRLVSPVMGEAWRWFRIHREECRVRAEKAGRQHLYEEAEQRLNRGPRLGPASSLLAGWEERRL